MVMMLDVVVPTDYYMEELKGDLVGSRLDNDLTIVRVEVTDEHLNCMSMEEFVEFVGIDSEFVVCTNWDELT
jgi:hypothetical protein